MKCTTCKGQTIKDGKTSKGVQRYRCKICITRLQDAYTYQACSEGVNNQIILLIKEGCGTRSISRILGISPTTVLKRILQISESIPRPPILLGQVYEVDEMMTYIGNKEYRFCIVYALDRKTREVVSYSVGRRNKGTLRMVINTLLLSEAKIIRTDKFPLYSALTSHAVSPRVAFQSSEMFHFALICTGSIGAYLQNRKVHLFGLEHVGLGVGEKAGVEIVIPLGFGQPYYMPLQFIKLFAN